MKDLLKILIASLMTNEAKLEQIDIPFSIQKTPGVWTRFGNLSSETNVTIFLDLLNPDSKHHHEDLRALMEKDTPMQHFNVRIIPFILPFHFHSFNLKAQLNFMEDWC